MKHKFLLLLLLLLLVISNQIFAQSQGPNNPGGATYSAIGCLACPGAEWSDLNNVFAADGLTADVGLNAYPNCFQTACYYSRFFIVNYFGFNIPTTATIDGVKVEMIRMSTLSPVDSMAQIITGGNAGNNHADSTIWTASPATITYGDSTDLWGLVLNPDSVNSINFGFRIMIRNTTSSSFTPSSIDNIKMTVYYSLPTGTFSQTRSTGGITIAPNPVKNELIIDNGKLIIEQIEIYNALGEKIYYQPVTRGAKQVTISAADFPPGIYFAVIDTRTEKITKKFVRSND